MRQYTYPAVFYYDDEYNQYAVEFSDICIYAEGDTIEDAYKNAQGYLVKYLECCDEFGEEPNTPNTYHFVEESHPDGKVMLVTVDYEPKTDHKTKTETFTNLNSDIVEDIDIASNISNKLYDDNPILNELMKEREKKQSQNANGDGDDGDDDFSLPEID